MIIFPGWYFFRRINALRKSQGLAPYKYSYGARRAGRIHCKNMIARNALYHADEFNPSWCTMYGQNVGEGPTCTAIADAFDHSPEHRANILDKGFKRVGIGVVKSNGIFWVTENFLAP